MDAPEVVLLVLATVGVGLVLVASRLGAPYPILVLAGGLALGFVPGMPEVTISPDVVLLVLLPPLLYSGAFFLPLREFRANLRPIGLLAVVVVALTTVAVAAVGHLALGLSWPVAFVLGAIVSPTDPIAFEAVANRLAVPRRLTSIIQGESLVNDGMALSIYASAVTAVTIGSVSAPEVATRLVLGIAGGVVIGLAVGWVLAEVRARVDSPPEELAISLLSAYAAYVPAEQLGASGVLAAVTIGAFHGRHQHHMISAATRIQTFSFWEMLVFLINAGLFIVIGVQLPAILGDLGGQSTGELVVDAAVVAGVVIAVRVVWVAGATGLLRLWDHSREETRALSSRYAVVVAATGMRGAVSLAAALAIPTQVDGGGAFPDRALLIFIAFAVIVVTLVPQGLGLPLLLDRLGLDGDEAVDREEDQARLTAARAGASRLQDLRHEDWVRADTADRLGELYDFRQRRFAARLHEDDGGRAEERSADYQRLRRELLSAEREALVELRERGEIDGDVLRRVERDLDLEDNRLS